MATRYREFGKRNSAASTLPVTESVSPVMASSFGTTHTSPDATDFMSCMS